MNKYLFKATYTPDDPASDRIRKAVVVESKAGVLDAITGALSLLEIGHLHDDFISEYLGQTVVEDTSEGFEWVVCLNNGEWSLAWYPFDSEDPVTKETLLAWAEKAAGDESIKTFLVCILGRNHWRSIDEWSSHDLKEYIHEIHIDGFKGKGYEEMDMAELLDAIMEEVVEGCRDNFDEAAKEKPFGLAVMVEDDKELWLGER